MENRTHNVQVSMDKEGVTQHGVYDPKILCADCDNKLGDYDDYAIDVCRRFNADKILDGQGMFTLPNVDGDKFAKFVLAVLWRASISRRLEYKSVSLGPYEAVARDVLFGTKTLSDMPQFQLMVFRYNESKKLRVDGLYTAPSTVSGLGVNGWGFAVSGFRFVAKMDKRPWPDVPADTAKEFVVNGRDRILGMFVDFEGSLEHRATLKMAGAALARKAKVKP
jgi:hypothetical protein